MEQITRKNLAVTLSDLKKEAESLDSKKYNFKITRSWPGMMLISNIQGIDTLVSTWAAIHEKVDQHKKAAEALGVTDMLGDDTSTFYGYTLEEWEADMKTCAEKIRNSQKVEKMAEAIKLLSRNLSEDDKFNADMKAVSELLG